MSCDRNGRACSNAAKRNGIMGHANRYLNTLGSWSSYRDLGSVDEIPERMAQVTEAFFGVKGLISGNPRIAGLLGIVVGIHATEQATGAVGTMGMRLLGRGEPFGKYKGVILRRKRPTRIAEAVSRLSGQRVAAADGYYFFESGKTWTYSQLDVQAGDTPRTWTCLKSFSIPGREFYFDRAIEPQQAVDLATGNLDPDTLPGFLGSINELESAAGGLGNLKRSLFVANWLLVDSTERDAGGRGFVDYDALVGGRKPGNDGYYRVNPSSTAVRSASVWPTTSRRTSTVLVTPSSATAQPIKIKPIMRSATAADTISPTPTAASVAFRNVQPLRIKRSVKPGDPTIYTDVDGQERPVVVRKIVKAPFSGLAKADAEYYDGEQWRKIVDDGLLQQLAQGVEEGKIKTMNN